MRLLQNIQNWTLFISLVIFTNGITNYSKAQTRYSGLFYKIVEPLNDSFLVSNKLNGEFVLYRDKQYHPCSKVNAVYSEIVYYDTGVLINFININFINKRIDRFESIISPKKPNSKIANLNGNYIGYDRNNIKVIEVSYKNGSIQNAIYYYPKSDSLVYVRIDFENLYNNILHTHYITLYNKDGSIDKEGYFYNYDNKGWAFVHY